MAHMSYSQNIWPEPRGLFQIYDKGKILVIIEASTAFFFQGPNGIWSFGKGSPKPVGTVNRRGPLEAYSRTVGA